MNEFNNENILKNFEDDAIGLDDEYGASSISDDDEDDDDDLDLQNFDEE
ncbi:MAG: hypothetical protein ABIJ28_00160 [Patescibacteria group bacterium]|nr:hypothetical protein [Patescibacteria group bacterium]